MALLVVGVDCSKSSSGALDWAVEEAALRGADVEAVHVWSCPPMTYLTGLVPTPTFAHDDLAAEARAVLDDVFEALGERGAAVRRVLLEGPPAAALMERAEGADLLVVGSRGRGGFAGLLLGSVSQQCAAHAPCPVVVVR